MCMIKQLTFINQNDLPGQPLVEADNVLVTLDI